MSKKLLIRINNLQDLDKNDSYEVTEETTIRWDRVIGVAVFALLLVIAIIVGLVMVFNANTTDTFEYNAESGIETVSVEPSTVLVEPSTEIAEVVNAPVVIENTVVDKVAVDAVAEDITPIESNPVVSTPTPVKTKKVEQTSPQLALGDPVDIKSENIVRAQLTNGVSKREPVDELGSTIPMNDKGLIKVFLFTGMHGLKGETLYHEWYLAGKRMARVKINVRNNNVSASSSKFIDKYMTGDWKVNVVNHNGDALVSAQFVVTP